MLRRLAGMHGRLPISMMVTDKVEISDRIRMSGGFADIRAGVYKTRPVAVKNLRVLPADDFNKIRKVREYEICCAGCSFEYSVQQFCKEVILWNSLSHPNILKLVGVLEGIDQCDFSTISEWMEHGNIMEYIKDNRYGVNRLALVCAGGPGQNSSPC
jgi:serine/threonine protein kinase